LSFLEIRVLADYFFVFELFPLFPSSFQVFFWFAGFCVFGVLFFQKKKETICSLVFFGFGNLILLRDGTFLRFAHSFPFTLSPCLPHTVIMSRSEPECAPAARLSATFKHSEVVSVPLPADVGTQKKFLAFPPDGEYELWLLAETEQAGPDFLGASVTHSLPFDASAILRAPVSPATNYVT